MGMYHETFGFHTPFQILMDSQFCVEASRSKLLDTSSVMKLMSRTVQDDCKLSESPRLLVETGAVLIGSVLSDHTVQYHRDVQTRPEGAAYG